ncbi:hypothetical protein ASPBRDRAFT_77189 [Aspergillus brasiliensis CBS 101740]|uniref:Uncharacterized protein n=1 Tax=Aspergillus brasiliensis (strain CBS 101740 / IMI 381727 / IBT 21946) TaxID=767769 RepID=A0A1L9UAZ8_ASPBC|nr:hypothetical protein ASPBRDRAFT_77189 [Aspergillus brasiliensis CBS 101740]
MTAIMNYFRRPQATDSGDEVFATVTASSSSPSWGEIDIKDLRDKDNNPVEFTEDDFLGITSLVPVKVESKDINVSTSPWYDATVEDDNFPSGDDFEVHLKLTFKRDWPEEPDTFVASLIQLGMGGDPRDVRYTKSVRLWKNYLPDETGTVPIACDARPDGITTVNQTVVFTKDDGIVMSEVPFDQKTDLPLNRGKYEVSAIELLTDDETTVATAKVQPDQLEVEKGKTAPTISVTYDVHHYSSTDVVVDGIPGLEGEKLHVKFSDAGGPLYDFWSFVPQTTKPRRVLPPAGNATTSVDSIIVNNVQYDFTPKQVDLSRNALVSFTATDVRQHQVHVPGAVKLPINLNKQDPTSAGTIMVHLIQKATGLIYKTKVKMQEENPQFPLPVAPGDYEVQASRFIENGILYNVTFDPSLSVSDDGTTVLELQVDLAVNLNVPGFPNFLSFGGCTQYLTEPKTLEDNDDDLTDFVQAAASSIFSYAGSNGAGDDDVDLPEEQEKTPKVIGLASNIEKAIGTDHTVLPVLISYTCNLSGGDKDVLTSTEKHKHSLGNTIQALQLTMKSGHASRPIRSAIILNPDFIGMCQKLKYGADQEVPFLDSLKEALKYRNEEDKINLIPDDIDNTLRGYVRALHWLVRTLTKDPDTGNPAVSLGWQVNLWAGEESGALWIYQDENLASDKAKKTAGYLRELGVWPDKASERANNELPPVDFLAVDRWERDDLTSASYPSNFCFAPREWRRHIDFCEALSMELHVPVMPWQISSARTPTSKDDVVERFPTAQHWGSGGSYFLGDPAIGSESYRIHPRILALGLNEQFYKAKTVEKLWKRSQPFDLSIPGYYDLHLRGIFAVLLGGGSTTGIVSSIPPGDKQDAWVREKLAEYIKNPIYFQTG